MLVTAVVLTLLVAGVSGRRGPDTIVVGSKNFTEQVILGELLAQAIEGEGGVRVERKLNLGGTFVADSGVRNGELDLYVEYTGTAVAAVFHEQVPHDSKLALERARDLYARQGLTVASPLGFNNTFAILVRGKDARTAGLRTIEDLRSVAARWTPGFGYEFLQREDGYPSLARAYGLRFGSQPRAMGWPAGYVPASRRRLANPLRTPTGSERVAGVIVRAAPSPCARREPGSGSRTRNGTA